MGDINDASILLIELGNLIAAAFLFYPVCSLAKGVKWVIDIFYRLALSEDIFAKVVSRSILKLKFILAMCCTPFHAGISSFMLQRLELK